ncbi:tetratricopeptide repeat protein [Prochlorothrix hollandica]|uniref:tetratricopeptide repeat protein n=1 Tax=Prochlorothrix hollandica TaxID=1223 RepID=UPI001CED8633|nr:tetratricopeptide repeat protein [Prochlorothrix hollandica]
MCEPALGANHPSTASSLNGLANLYQSMGRYEEALPLYGRSVEICAQVLGPNHPNTQTVQKNLQNCQNQMTRSPPPSPSTGEANVD